MREQPPPPPSSTRAVRGEPERERCGEREEVVVELLVEEETKATGAVEVVGW